MKEITEKQLDEFMEASSRNSGIDELEKVVGIPVYLVPATGTVNYRRFIYQLIRYLEPTNFVELGVFQGHTSKAALLADDNIKVIGVDDLRWADRYPLKLEDDRFVFFEGDTVEMANGVKGECGNSIDVILFDATHKGAKVREEMKAYKPACHKGSVLLFDDVDVGGIEHSILSSNREAEMLKIYKECGGSQIDGTDRRDFAVVVL